MIQCWDPTIVDGFPVMSRDQVRAFDRWAIEQMGIPGAVLMENAGRNAAACLAGLLPAGRAGRVVIFCGSGNNGGDGFVMARHLANRKTAVTVVLCGGRDRIRGEAQTHLQIVEAMGLPIEPLDGSGDILARVRRLTDGADWLVDALLGTGLSGQVKETMAELICAINASGVPVFAVDIPSGLDCDAGIPLPICIQAEATVTFAAVKKGFAETPECRQTTGPVYLASIGIAPRFMPGA